MVNNYISIIIPITGIGSSILKYRNKYDKFASYGIPPHITLMYNIPLNIYNEHKQFIKTICIKFLNLIQKADINIESIVKTKTLLGLALTKHISSAINKLQININKSLELKNAKYTDNMFYPHITLFSGQKNKGWMEYNKINTAIKEHLPIPIKIKKLYVLEINPDKNIAKKIKTLKIKSSRK